MLKKKMKVDQVEDYLEELTPEQKLAIPSPFEELFVAHFKPQIHASVKIRYSAGKPVVGKPGCDITLLDDEGMRILQILRPTRNSSITVLEPEDNNRVITESYEELSAEFHDAIEYGIGARAIAVVIETIQAYGAGTLADVEKFDFASLNKIATDTLVADIVTYYQSVENYARVLAGYAKYMASQCDDAFDEHGFYDDAYSIEDYSFGADIPWIDNEIDDDDYYVGDEEDDEDMEDESEDTEEE